MHHDRIAFSDKRQHFFQGWALGVFAGSLIGKHLTDLDLFQLPFRILVERADSDVTNPMPLQMNSPQKTKSVRIKSMAFGGMCQYLQKHTLS